uniref:octanoyl-[acyl-carrier-protein]:protein N-octanoyltransferase LIPT2, mitochondrial n=1 Tax=Myxine glutinosa TaxID=7769 RepID=UPI00358E7E91
MPSGVPPLYVLRLGRVPYGRAMDVQNRLVRAHRAHLDGTDWRSNPDARWKEGAHAPDVLVLCEHDPVYTVGLRQTLYPPDEEARLRKLGADFQRTDRGGLITFFGPGMLVAYPVINLARRRCGLRLHVEQLRHAATTTCRSLGVGKAESRGPPETGVWMGNKKLCAFGVHCARHITTHGLALYCDPDLSWFQHIVPCGLEGRGVTSLTQELGHRVSTCEAMTALLPAIAEAYGCRLLEAGPDV